MAGWSKTQKAVALSSGEAEFYSATTCGAELLWVKSALQEMGVECKATLREDASACIGMATRLGPGHVKHLQIRHLALQEWVRDKRLDIVKESTRDQCGTSSPRPWTRP